MFIFKCVVGTRSSFKLKISNARILGLLIIENSYLFYKKTLLANNEDTSIETFLSTLSANDKMRIRIELLSTRIWYT